jgi:hypothetical protein
LGALTTHVLGAHVDVTLEAKQRARSRTRDTVLPRAGFGDDTRLAHAFGKQRLPSALLILCAPVAQGLRV